MATVLEELAFVFLKDGKLKRWSFNYGIW